MKVRVTFRNAHDRRPCMLAELFESVDAARTAIMSDACAFIMLHSNLKARRRCLEPRAEWIKQSDGECFQAIAKDGMTCYWRYFVE